MPLNDDLDAILKRIEDGQQSEEDLMMLRQFLRGDGHREVLQKLAKYNVHVQELAGRDFQIGDRIYNGWTEQAIDKLLQVIRSEIAELRQVQLSRTDLNAEQEVIDFCEIPPCPYQGLSAFQEEHAEFFFGREEFTESLVRAVETQRLVAVIGASGSGKSSVVYAGLIPKLRATGNWLIEPFRPRSQPLYGLASALVRLLKPELDEIQQPGRAAELLVDLEKGTLTLSQVLTTLMERNSGKRLLLFIDQFEELYTLCKEPQQQIQYIDVLLNAIQSNSPDV